MAIHLHSRVTHNDHIFGEHHRSSHQRTDKLPAIPDLRFEYSYLRSIRPYVHVERVRAGSVSAQQLHNMSTEELFHNYEKVELPGEALRGDANEHVSARSPSRGPKEIVHVQWKKVIWATTRDQVISPFLQGAFWAILVYFLSPYSASLGSKLGHLMHTKVPPKEGNAAGWLRKWVKGLGLTSKSADELRR